MGGKKKPTISQLVKKEAKEKTTTERKERGGKGKAVEETTKKTVLTVSAELYQQIQNDLAKVDYITTYMVASKYGLKMSVASKVLEDLVKKGELAVVSKGHRMALYMPVDKARKLGFIQ